MVKRNSILQISLITLAVVAVFGLYLFGKTTQPLSLEKAASALSTEREQIEVNTENLILSAKEELTPEEKQRLENTSSKDVVTFWQSIDRNDVAAIYAQDAAEQNGNFERWNNVGDLSIRAFREVADTTEKLFFIQEAVSSYQKALDFQQDVNTKLKLAKIHTSLTGATMEGVLLLREVVEEEPKNIQANYELGLLSLQSGQNDKAIERFNLLIQEEPKFIEPYILKAQLLMGENKKQEAIDVINAAMDNTENENGIAVLQEMKERIK